MAHISTNHRPTAQSRNKVIHFNEFKSGYISAPSKHNTIWGITIPRSTSLPQNRESVEYELIALRKKFSLVADRANSLLDLLAIEQENTERFKWLYEKTLTEITSLKETLKARGQEHDT